MSIPDGWRNASTDPSVELWESESDSVEFVSPSMVYAFDGQVYEPLDEAIRRVSEVLEVLQDIRSRRPR
jgi:hypothetical protein